MKFKPERFLVPEAERPLDPNNIAFGYGRRICPGRYVAENHLWYEQIFFIKSTGAQLR